MQPNSPAKPRLRTRILPPAPFALALGLGWWTGQSGLGQLRWFGSPDLEPALITLGWLMVSLGLLLMTAAVLTLWRHRTTVNPFGRARTLCVTGPFAWSRNPIYLADFLVLLGGGWVLNSVWPAVLAPAIGWLIRHHVVAHEEAFLSAEFGPAYDDYLARVNRWFGRKKTPAQGRG